MLTVYSEIIEEPDLYFIFMFTVTLLFVIIWTVGLNLNRKLGGFFMLLQHNVS